MANQIIISNVSMNDQSSQSPCPLSNCLVNSESWLTLPLLLISLSIFIYLIPEADPHLPNVNVNQSTTIKIVDEAEGTEVKQAAKNLGVIFDSELSMSQHISRVIQSCNYQLINMWRVAGNLTRQQKIQLVNSLIHSRIDYCSALLVGIKDSDVRRLQKLQNSATRFIFGQRSRRGVSDLRKKCHFLPIRHRIEYKICLLVYKSLNGDAPSYMTEMVEKRQPKAKRLRVDNDTTRLEEVHSTCNYKTTERAFSVAAPKIWNRLPEQIRNSETLYSFKKSLKTCLFRLAYNCNEMQ